MNNRTNKCCLVTGGAGFIGCAISSDLADIFEQVLVMDNLHPQIHASGERPSALDSRVAFVKGDVTVQEDWDSVLSTFSPEVVIHLAAETGTGQSLTEANRHGNVNVVGTTQMLDALIRHERIPGKILLTSSRAVYGEGLWKDDAGNGSYPGQRTRSQLESGQWDFDGLRATPFESSSTEARPTSVYGATKLAQEHILKAWCLSLGAEAVILRLQNVYGPGQSLINPYTGIVSLFARLAKGKASIPVYEDGAIIRDFVFIDDVVRAIISALTSQNAASTDPYDIGSGEATSISRLAEMIAERYGAPVPRVTGAFRFGDVRHASCDISRARALLGWSPDIMVKEGVERLCTWIDAGTAR